jgi:prolyl-tRNA synthetase
VVVTPINVADAVQGPAALEVVQALEAAGFDVLYDDRDERPGVKFKDSDLIGVPYRITVGKKVSEGKVELLDRSTRETHDATISGIAGHFSELLRRRGH